VNALTDLYRNPLAEPSPPASVDDLSDLEMPL